MAAKTKYDKETFPKLAEGFARDGLNDEEIAAKLGISHTTLYNYQEKYIEFFEAIKRGKAPVDVDVENALLKRALGYEYIEEHKTVTDSAENGHSETIKTIKKHIAPDVGAIAFWLKNRKSSQWKERQTVDHNLENAIAANIDDIFGKIEKDIKQEKE